MKRTHEFRGSIYAIGGDRQVVVDLCPGAAEHMASPPQLSENPAEWRRYCRQHVADIFSDLIGKRGVLKVTIEFAEEELG